MAAEINEVFANDGYEEAMQESEFIRNKLEIICETFGEKNDMKVEYVILTSRRRMIV